MVECSDTNSNTLQAASRLFDYPMSIYSQAVNLQIGLVIYILMLNDRVSRSCLICTLEHMHQTYGCTMHVSHQGACAKRAAVLPI